MVAPTRARRTVGGHVKKLPARRMAILMTVAAVAAAGCGSSSSSKNKPANPAATASTPTAAATGGVSASTPITAPAYRALLIRGEQQATQGKFTQAQPSS